ncbi:MAG: Gfo/Idh/MocA family oxidoreductase [Candidatus Atribacteria bacterium]|nr:Gfo/Idh/MocA family oxidoreductase [Candidatus Atribacteria bacterium]
MKVEFNGKGCCDGIPKQQRDKGKLQMIVNVIPVSGKFSCVIVGTGSIGQRHLRVLQASGAVNVFAFPVRMQRLLELQAAKIPTVENWIQAKELGITHAIIATDTSRHSVDVQAALDADCDVLVEKPMATDAVAALHMWQAAKQYQRNLWVGCCMRFHQALNTFRDQLPRLGKIHSVRIECQSYLPDWRPDRPYQDSYSARYDEGGVLRDLVHEIDYAGWLFGWAEAVTAKVRATQHLNIVSEDTADLLWETHNGMVISITLDYLSRPARRQMRAHGEFGTLEWDGLAGQVTLALAGKSPCEISSTQTRDEMYLTQDLAFIEATSGSYAPDARLATGADGVRALAICDTARIASQNKSEMKVRYPVEL